MTARDDYPQARIYDRPDETWYAMCNEIDRLRAGKVEARYLDELIKTLTTHADAMRRVILTLCKGSGTAMRIVEEYDTFIKEC